LLEIFTVGLHISYCSISARSHQMYAGTASWSSVPSLMKAVRWTANSASGLQSLCRRVCH